MHAQATLIYPVIYMSAAAGVAFVALWLGPKIWHAIWKQPNNVPRRRWSPPTSPASLSQTVQGVVGQLVHGVEHYVPDRSVNGTAGRSARTTAAKS